MTMQDKIDAAFHSMCRASQISHAPDVQLVDMRRAFYGGAAVILGFVREGDDIAEIRKAFDAFAQGIGTEEEIRRAAP